MITPGIDSKIILSDDSLFSSSDCEFGYALEYEEKFLIPFIPFDHESFSPFINTLDNYSFDHETDVSENICVDDDQNTPAVFVAQRIAPRIKSSQMVGGKCLSRLYALWMLYTGYLPDTKPDYISDEQWDVLTVQKSKDTLIEDIRIQENQLTVVVNAQHDVICRITAIYGREHNQKFILNDEHYKTHLRWWSDTPVFKPVNTRRSKYRDTHIRTITLPKEWIASEYFDNLDDRSTIEAVAYLFKLIIKKSLHPDDFDRFIEGRLPNLIRGHFIREVRAAVISSAINELNDQLAAGKPLS